MGMGTEPTFALGDQATSEPGHTEPGELLTIEVGVETVSEGRRSVRLALAGEIDPHTAPLLQAAVDRAIDGGCHSMVLDLGRVRFIDSAGLRVIIGAHRHLEAVGGAMVIESPSDMARRLFEITGLTHHLVIEDRRP